MSEILCKQSAKLVRNKGEKQMYYIRHDHPAIVSEELWETAQEKLAKKSERNRQGLPSDEIVVTEKAQVPDMPEKRTLKETILQKEKSGLIPVKQPLTLTNYPYKDRIFCKYCGSRLRRIIARNHSVWWICNGLSRKEKLFAKVSAYQMKSFPRFETSIFQHISERSL